MAQCPSSTFGDQEKGVCVEVTTPTLYFPACITSLILLILVGVCNCCIAHDLTDSHRTRINMVTYSSTILAYT